MLKFFRCEEPCEGSIYFNTAMKRINWQSLVHMGLIILLFACAGPATKLSEKEKPNEAEDNVQKALSYLKQDKPQQALDKILLALKQDPKLVSAYNVAGMIYEKHDQPDLADKYFKRAVELAPKDAKTHNNYGKFLCKRKQFKEAEEHFLIAVDSEMTRAAEVAYTNAGLCTLRIPDPDRAAQYFRAAIAANPEMAIPYYQLARIDFEKKRYIQARRYFQSYLHYGIQTSKALWLGIGIEHALGNQATQTEYARLLKEKFPDSEETDQLMKQYPELYMSILNNGRQKNN